MRCGRSTLCSLYFGGYPLWRVGLRGGHGMTLRCSGGSTMVGCSLPLDSAAERFGAPDLAMHLKGMALTYATSSKGAHHMFAITFGYEIAAGNRLEEAGKGELQRNHQFSMCAVDSIGMCSTMRIGISMEDMCEALRAVSGRDMSTEDINLAAERIINLERMYNVRMGFSRKDDSLPKRFLSEAMENGETAGQTVDLDKLLDEYYQAMGWD